VAARWDFYGTLAAFTLVFVQNAFAAIGYSLEKSLI
jgi:hypothetical protein